MGLLDNLPNPGHLEDLERSQQQNSTTRSLAGNENWSPPRKRQHSNFDSRIRRYNFGMNEDQNEKFNFGRNETTLNQLQDLQIPSMPGVIFASDFQGPAFEFEGPAQPELPPEPETPANWFPDAGVQPMEVSDDNGDCLMNALLEALTPPGCNEEMPEQPRRSSRTRIQTQYFQSEEVERQEKAAREKEH